MRIGTIGGTTAILVLLAACGPQETPPAPDYRVAAEQFFTGVFGCVPDRIDEWAAEDVIVSYPIFETVLGTSSISGREAVRRFSAGFCSRWSDPKVVVHEAIQDGNRVALIWGFEATPVTGDSAASAPRGWGGIPVFTFDAEGRVVREVGEESTPGPIARITSPP